jgi:hypothetical protein
MPAARLMSFCWSVARKLLWLSGVALIIFYWGLQPYRLLDLADDEEIVGFLGTSHDLITVRSNTPDSHLRHLRPYPVRSPYWKEWLRRGLWPWRTNESWTGLKPRYMNWGTAIQIRDLDAEKVRTLSLPGVKATYGIWPCATGRRLCILDDMALEPSGLGSLRIVVVDAAKDKVIRSVSFIANPETWGWHREWSISADGRTAAFVQSWESEWKARTVAIDVDSGRELMSTLGTDPVMSPDGRWLAIAHWKPLLSPRPWEGYEHAGTEIFDLPSGQSRGEMRTQMRCISFGSDHLLLESVDLFGTIGRLWDVNILSPLGRRGLFLTDRGRYLLRLEKPGTQPTKAGTEQTLKWYDAATGKEVPDRSVVLTNFSSTEEGRILPVTDDGERILVDGDWSEMPLPIHRSMLRLGLAFKPNRNYWHDWKLIDGASARVLNSGTAKIYAISPDGRYAVTAQNRDLLFPVIDLDKSAWTTVLAIVAWTVLTYLVGRIGRKPAATPAEAA